METGNEAGKENVNEPTPGPSKTPARSDGKDAGQDPNEIEKFKVREGGIRQIHLGDSHLRKAHHLPEMYARRRAEGRADLRFAQPERMEKWEQEEQKKGEKRKESIWDPGFQLTSEYLAQLKDLVKDCSGKATAMVLSIGTNDLRAEPTSATLYTLVERFKELMEAVEKAPGVALYLVAPIPCKRGISHLRNELDRELWNLVQQFHPRTGSRIYYINITKEGDPNSIPWRGGGHHTPKFWDDDLHLNRAGAQLLADTLIRAMGYTPSAPFMIDKEVWQRRDQRPVGGRPPRGRSRSRKVEPRQLTSGRMEGEGTGGWSSYEPAPKKQGKGGTRGDLRELLNGAADREGHDRPFIKELKKRKTVFERLGHKEDSPMPHQARKATPERRRSRSTSPEHRRSRRRTHEHRRSRSRSRRSCSTCSRTSSRSRYGRSPPPTCRSRTRTPDRHRRRRDDDDEERRGGRGHHHDRQQRSRSYGRKEGRHHHHYRRTVSHHHRR